MDSERDREMAFYGLRGMEGGFTASAVFTLEAFSCSWRLHMHSLFSLHSLFSRYSQLC